MTFVVKHGTGTICVAMKEEDLKRLKLPLMVQDKENEEKLLIAFMVYAVCSAIFLFYFNHKLLFR